MFEKQSSKTIGRVKVPGATTDNGGGKSLSSSLRSAGLKSEANEDDSDTASLRIGKAELRKLQ